MKKNITRRDFLRMTALGAGAATLAACAPSTPTAAPAEPVKPADTQAAAPEVQPTEAPKPTDTQAPAQAPAAEITITTSGWPLDVYAEDQIKNDSSVAAIAAAIQAWMDKNPGVQMKKVDVNIWDPQAIQAMVVGGTDCTYLFGPCVGGGWGREEAKNAFVQGMLADVTPIVAKLDLAHRTQDFIWNVWSANTQVDSKYWAIPLDEYAPGVGTLVYRKDLLTEAGIEEPKVGWTWEQMAETLKKVTNPDKKITGLAAATWFMAYSLSFYGWDILTETPQPGQPYHWTRDFSDPRWAELAKAYRTLQHKDKAILSDATIASDTEVTTLFREGAVAFGRLNYWSMFGSPTDANSFASMAKRLGKEYKDVISVVSIPTGDGFQSGNDAQSGGVSYSPNQKAEVHEKAAELVDWMFWDKGLDMTKKAAWDAAKDPQAVYSAFLYMSGRKSFEGVPGWAQDAWGQEVVDRWNEIARIPVQPRKEDFFPAEKNPTPTNQAIDDQFSLMVSDPKDMDVAAMLKKAQEDYVAQLGGFSSSISEADFTAAANKYYAGLDAYFKEKMPEFYEKRYKPFFESKVAPALG